MKKIKLEMETLEIVSFETAPAAADGAGTVLAYATRPGQDTCGGENTCVATCEFRNSCMSDCDYFMTVDATCTCPVETTNC